jgi:monoamine oxidase
MARSALFAALERLVETSHAGRMAGTDAEEVAGRRAEMAASDEGMTRRQVLAAGLLGAAAVSTGQLARPQRAGAAVRPAVQLPASPAPSSQPVIAIIGAGISGMSAAMTLRDRGFTRVTVYEANTRIGGRTFTRSGDGFFESGQWAEWGGELIDSGHKTVFSLCHRYGFSTIDLGWHSVSTNGAADTLYFNGGYFPWADAVRDWKAAGLEQLIQKQMGILPPYPWPYNATWSPDALALSRMSIATWIDTYVPGGRTSRLGRFLDAAYAIEFGENVERQSVLNLLGLLGFSNGGGTGAWWVYGKSDERWKIVGGNQQIALAQAAELGSDHLALGRSLGSARRRASDGKAVLQFQAGTATETVVADRVIFAIPLGIMKKIRNAGGFSGAGFDTDARKMGSIDNLGFGADNKLQLQIRDRFWTTPGPWGNGNGESYSDTGYQEAWAVTIGQPGTTGIINNYTGGDVSRLLSPSAPFTDTSSRNSQVAAYVAGAASTFLEQIEPVYPGITSRWTGKAQLSVWHVNPYSLGAYSFYPPGYCDRFCTYERVAARPFHFAGEHVSQEAQGYIEGGAVEGIRAATEIAADFV